MTSQEAKDMLAKHNPLNLSLATSPHHIARTLACLPCAVDADFRLIVASDGVFVAYGNGEPVATSNPLAFEFLKLILIRTHSVFVTDEALLEALVLLKYWHFPSDYSPADLNNEDHERREVGGFLMDPSIYQGHVEWAEAGNDPA